MNIIRIINKNRKIIWYVIIIILFILFAIKFLNSYYEEVENKKQIELKENVENSSNKNLTENDYTTESNSIEKTIRSFVNYCNSREIENAYKMLTEECKKAIFPTVEQFEKRYVNNIYDVKREYELTKWSTDGNKTTYLVTLYGDILASGSTDNLTQEYYTFIEDANGNYKLNINNYIYGEDRNIEKTINNVTIKIGHIDIYDEYEEITFSITNNTSKTICLTGNKYNKNIYLQNSKDVTYSSLNSEFDTEEITMEPNRTKSFTIRFNKAYTVANKARYIVLSDVILDYEDYLKNDDKDNYWNRTSIKVQYQK